jgi:alpha-ribazole phosphatase
MTQFWCWRHPRAQGASGRCIGRTDLPVDPRKAKRLAHQIRKWARRQQLPCVVHVSHLARSRHVGLWLRHWGWRVVVDTRLAELDFGHWDGKPWTAVPWSEVEAWQENLLHGEPGGGESLFQLSQRMESFVASHAAQAHCLLVSHGGWINALMHVPPEATEWAASAWPTPPRHGSLTRVTRAAVR